MFRIFAPILPQTVLSILTLFIQKYPVGSFTFSYEQNFAKIVSHAYVSAYVIFVYSSPWNNKWLSIRKQRRIRRWRSLVWNYFHKNWKIKSKREVSPYFSFIYYLFGTNLCAYIDSKYNILLSSQKKTKSKRTIIKGSI